MSDHCSSHMCGMQPHPSTYTKHSVITTWYWRFQPLVSKFWACSSISIQNLHQKVWACPEFCDKGPEISSILLLPFAPKCISLSSPLSSQQSCPRFVSTVEPPNEDTFGTLKRCPDFFRGKITHICIALGQNEVSWLSWFQGVHMWGFYCICMMTTFLNITSGEGSAFLSFRKGDLIILENETGEDIMQSSWCYGQCERTGAKGDFPAQCVYALPTLTKPSPNVLVSNFVVKMKLLYP